LYCGVFSAAFASMTGSRKFVALFLQRFFSSLRHSLQAGFRTSEGET
jgi:hypothetical protein